MAWNWLAHSPSHCACEEGGGGGGGAIGLRQTTSGIVQRGGRWAAGGGLERGGRVPRTIRLPISHSAASSLSAGGGMRFQR